MLDFHKPLRTLGGAPVRIVCWDRRDPAMPIVALAMEGDEEVVICMDASGRCIDPPCDWEGDLIEENPRNVVNGPVATVIRAPHPAAPVASKEVGPPSRALLDRTRPIRTRGGLPSGRGEMPVRVVCWDRVGDMPIVALYEDGTGEGVITARLDGSVGPRGDDEGGRGQGGLENVDQALGERQRVLVRAEFEILLEPGQVATHHQIEQRIRAATVATIGMPGRFLGQGPCVSRVLPVRWELSA